MIRDALIFICENYLAQAQQNFAGNQLGEYVRGGWRRERDSNPRGLAPNTLSRRAP